MLNDLWINILRLIPAEQHNQIMMVTRAGIEVAVEAVFRLEPDYLVLRGRPAGSTDSGRVFFIPYSELDYAYLNRDVSEDEVRAIYGEAPREVEKPVEAEEPAAVAEEPTPPAPVPTPPASVTPLPGRPLASDAASAAKVNLLERIRAARNSAIASRNGP